MLLSSSLGFGGGFRYAEATLPTANGVWSGDWFREAYGWFASALHLDYATAGGVLFANSGKNATTDTGFTYDPATNTQTVANQNVTGALYANLYYQGSNNRTDTLQFPWQEVSFIIGQETYGSTPYYCKSGTTGQIAYSGSDIAWLINNATSTFTNGGMVFIKSGRYETSHAIILKDSMRLIGEGENCTTIVQNDVSVDTLSGVYTTTNPYFIEVSNMRIHGGSIGINLNDTYSPILENLRFTSQASHSIYISYSYDVTLNKVYSTSAGSRGFYIKNCNKVEGMAYSFSSASHGIQIENSQGVILCVDIESATSYSLNLLGLKACKFNGWIERGGNWASIYLTGGASNSTNNIFTELWIDGNAKDHGIIIDNSDYTRITSSVYIQNTSGTNINILDPTADYTIIEWSQLSVTDAGTNTKTGE